jgi:hypothetical protein
MSHFLEFVAAVVREATQRDVAAKVRLTVRVAAWTPEGALAGNLDREVRASPLREPDPHRSASDDYPSHGPVATCSQYATLWSCQRMKRRPPSWDTTNASASRTAWQSRYADR